MDITKNIIHTIPLTIPFKQNIAVRGEVSLYWEDFTEKLEGTHPRNKAAGLSQSLHSKKSEVNLLRFIAYDVLTSTKDKRHLIWMGIAFSTLMTLKIGQLLGEMVNSVKKGEL